MPNIVYPLTGNIGLGKTVNFFARYLENGTDIKTRNDLAKNALLKAMKLSTGDKFLELSSSNDSEGAIRKLSSIAKYLTQQATISSAEEAANLAEGVCYKIILARAANIYSQEIRKHQDKYSGSLAVQKEVLTFTTVLSGGISPSIKFANVTRPFSVTGGAWSSTGTRTDTDQITIDLTPATPYKSTETVSEAYLIALGRSKNEKLLVSVPIERTKKNGSCSPMYRNLKI